MVIDPHAGYARAVRQALPAARLADVERVCDHDPSGQILAA